MQSSSYDRENPLVRAETLVNGTPTASGGALGNTGKRVAKTAEIGGERELKHFLWQGLRMLREETPG